MDFATTRGREESTGTLPMRAFNNFLNPAYTSSWNVTDVDAEVQRLYDQTGARGAPAKPSASGFAGERRSKGV